jgi:threonine dehydratase
VSARFDARDIRAAYARIPAELRNSPQFVHDGLSARAGRPVVIKVEAVNPIRAFKGRGTWLAVAGLVAEGEVSRKRGLVVASTGNFGQGVAYAARAHRIRAVVYAHASASPAKLARVERLGASVERVGHDFDAAREAAAERARTEDWALLVDGEDRRVAIGAGSIGLEVTLGTGIANALPLESAWVPVGNGALICGIGTWLRAAAPGTRVIGVQSAAAPSMTISWREGRPIPTESADTYADGIATRVPVPEALEDMRDVVDDMVLVEEDEIRAAQDVLTYELGITIEAAAAVGWAAALRDGGHGSALIIVTGSNAER